MANLNIIRDQSALNKGLNQFRQLQTKVRNLSHLLAVSTLVHANEHGDPALLNRFYKMLVPNDQRAFQNYVKRFQQVRDEQTGEWKPTNMAFIRFDAPSKEWAIDKTTPVEQRQKGSAFVKHAEANLINPDGKTYVPFYMQDNVKDIQEFKDDNILTSLRGLVTKSTGDSKTVVSKVSEPMQRFVQKMYEQARQIAEEAGDNVVPFEKKEEAKAEQPAPRRRGRPRKAANA